MLYLEYHFLENEETLMRVMRQTLAKLGIVGEIFVFLWRRRLWWLIPMVTVLILFGLLLISPRPLP